MSNPAQHAHVKEIQERIRTIEVIAVIVPRLAWAWHLALEP